MAVLIDVRVEGPPDRLGICGGADTIGETVIEGEHA